MNDLYDTAHTATRTISMLRFLAYVKGLSLGALIWGAAASAGVNPDPAAAAGAPNYYVTRQGDSLWIIADREKPAGISVEEYGNAILAANPEAFKDSDMNTLLPNRVLVLPTATPSTTSVD